MSVIPNFSATNLVAGAGIGIVFPVGKKSWRWYHGVVKKVHPIAENTFWAAVEFHDGTEQGKVWELIPDNYNAIDAVEPNKVIWRLHDSVPIADYEELVLSKPTGDGALSKPTGDGAGPSAPSAPAPSAPAPSTQEDRFKALIAEALAPINTRLITLEKEVARVQAGATPAPRRTGIFTHDEMAAYNRLSPAQKAKYFGAGRWQGIIYPDDNRKMCASYKINDIDFACVTRKFDTDDQRYVSDAASFVSWAWYADADVIKMTPKELVVYLKDRSVCKTCANQCFGGSSTLHQIADRGKLCGICKATLVKFKVQDGVIPVCTECARIMAAEGSREKIVASALRMLPFRFDTFGITLRTKESSNGRFADFVMAGTYSNPSVVKGKFYVLIERDQDQHRGYDEDDERAKIIAQVAPLLRMESTRVIVIRYNPDGAYKDDHGNAIGADLAEVDRLVMLRNWVIWYIATINTINVKRLLSLYLWYNMDSSEGRFEAGTDGYGMTDKAPKGAVSDHEFSVEANEAEHETYSKTRMYVDVGVVFRNIKWSANDRLSAPIRQEMMG